MKRFTQFCVVAMALVFSNPFVWAGISSGTWLLNQSNTFPDNINYGSVTINADNGTGKIEFKVEAFDTPYYNAIGSNFGFTNFGFNFINLSTPDTWTSLLLPAGWTQDNTGGTMDGFGNFMVTEDGTGNNRQSTLEFSFVLPNPSQAMVENFEVLSTGSAGQGPVFFAAHLAGFSNETATSHYIGGSTRIVPAPGAVVLGLIGLWVVGRIKRRSL